MSTVDAHTFTIHDGKCQTLSAGQKLIISFLGKDRRADSVINAATSHNSVINVLCDTKKRLHGAIENKRHGMLTCGMVVLRDDARRSSACRSSPSRSSGH